MRRRRASLSRTSSRPTRNSPSTTSRCPKQPFTCSRPPPQLCRSTLPFRQTCQPRKRLMRQSISRMRQPIYGPLDHSTDRAEDGDAGDAGAISPDPQDPKADHLPARPAMV